MASERVRELARKHPEAFERIANIRDDLVGEHMSQVLREEQASQDRATVSAN
jgi:hypothetical protein